MIGRRRRGVVSVPGVPPPIPCTCPAGTVPRWLPDGSGLVHVPPCAFAPADPLQCCPHTEGGPHSVLCRDVVSKPEHVTAIYVRNRGMVPIDQLPAHGEMMPHDVRWPSYEIGGCPTYCPRRLAVLDACPECASTDEDGHHYLGCSRLPARPAEPEPESPRALAVRLDRERDDAGRVYREAIYAADEAWRAIGGRP